MPALVRLEDELDAVLNLESDFQNEGFHEAVTAGRAVGIEEGRALGWKAGAAMATELEFYHGAASALLAVSDAFKERISDKAVAVAKRILHLISEAPLAERGNDANLDMDGIADTARGMFKQMAAFSGLPTLRFDLASRSLLADLSF